MNGLKELDELLMTYTVDDCACVSNCHCNVNCTCNTVCFCNTQVTFRKDEEILYEIRTA